jgi:mannan endo-1,4-beta-mannosidase
MMKKIDILLFLVITIEITLSCSKKEEPIITEPIIYPEYSISGSKILYFENSIQCIGANTFHSFGGQSDDMNAWNLDIAREFVGNISQNPITGSAVQVSPNSYLHSLQEIVANNRLNHKITIIGAFGWDGTNQNEFTGKKPQDTFYWNDFKIKLAAWAAHFKDQHDVWIEVWNEPYRYDRADGYTDDVWMTDMNELVSIIRNTGNNNIIIVPCAEQGQDESVLINKGAIFLTNKTNILFDIHAYEKWLLLPDSNITSRLDNLKSKNLPIIFGEVAPLNAGELMNPTYFLNNIYNRGLSVCAWLWKYDQNDTDALLKVDGTPNNTNNNNWGATYKELALRVRKPGL